MRTIVASLTLLGEECRRRQGDCAAVLRQHPLQHITENELSLEMEGSPKAVQAALTDCYDLIRGGRGQAREGCPFQAHIAMSTSQGNQYDN